MSKQKGKRISFVLLIQVGLLIVGAYFYPESRHREENQMEKKHAYTNRLIHETSPYLLQHAHNPVYWYSWGEEALERAKKEERPIFLSIGYAACHWCHVMEKESFENEEIADILNKNFISIKVDREERPDLDEIYMAAVVAVSGSGGWPMTVFLTPELKPFVGGTYFPPEDKWGRIGFKKLITRISGLWKDKEGKEKIHKDAETITKMIKERTAMDVSIDKDALLNKKLLENAVNQIAASFDSKWGGFSSAPKFPASNAISFLLRDYHHTGNKKSLEMATFTLDKMYEGGMYDHLAGGFHRYSTDEMWLVPHFEKMLYDNAQLAFVYTEAFQLTGNNRYGRVAEEIFDYVIAAMTDKKGGIYSTEDADSEGKEGIFYLWEFDEIDNNLSKKEAELFSEYFTVKKEGNFSSHESYHKGLNILHITQDLETVARKHNMKKTDLEDKLLSIKKKLIKIREKRVHPSLDDKIITSWNALMMSAFARGFQVFGEKRYLQAAENIATFILEKLRTKDGKLLRTFRRGKAKLHAYLEDYACTARGFIELYEAGFNHKWLFAAEALAEEMVNLFWDEKSSSFFNTSQYHKNLIVRPKTAHDGATPSPTGVATETLLRLSKFLAKEDYLTKAHKLFQANHPYLERFPQAHLSLLKSVDFLVYPAKEIAIVGQKESADTRELLGALHSHFVPNRVIAFIDPDQAEGQNIAKKIPLLANRDKLNGKSTVYICENYACKLPVTTPNELIAELDAKDLNLK